jgi:hypothetical protein
LLVMVFLWERRLKDGVILTQVINDFFINYQNKRV